MDYEQKYKDALGWMQSLYKGLHGVTKEDAEHYFPELKESEDEKNIKELISELKCSLRAAICQNDVCGGGHEKRIALLEWGIAWLEKQGKQTHVELGQSEVTKTSDQELEPKKLDPDKVIAWIVANICDFEYYVKLFKKDFGL